MVSERSAAVLDTLPETYLYPVVIGLLLVGTAVALSTGRDVLGILGVLALSVVSVTYGAMQRPEDFRD